MVQSDISIDDFEFVLDERTGQRVLRLRADVAARKGLTSLLTTNFEVVTDPFTGEQMIRIKPDQFDSNEKGRIEIVTDAVTGKQTIRLVVDEDENGEGADER